MGTEELNFYIGQKFDGVYPPTAAIWCMQNSAKIEEKTRTVEIDGYEVQAKYYEIVEIPEPDIDIKKENIRKIRDSYINNIEWRISRYRGQLELGEETTDSQETYTQILLYMQYLRDYPELCNDWYEKQPMTWDDFYNVS